MNSFVIVLLESRFLLQGLETLLRSENILVSYNLLLVLHILQFTIC